MKSAPFQAPLPLAMATLFASLSLSAQTTPATPGAPATPVRHHATTPATHSAAGGTASQSHTGRRTATKLPEAGPVLPPGVPPAPGKLETAFALRYVDSKLGEGDPVAPGQFITVQYTGWLASNGTKFDSSLDRNTPFTFPQGMHRVITGWDQGFSGMRVGGKRRLFIPYQLAYGDDGRPPVIPAKSDLIFDIELVGASATPPPPAPAAAPGDAQPQ